MHQTYPYCASPVCLSKTDPAKRLGLHSHTLKLRHPVTGVPLSFESPLPLELARLM